MKEKVEGGAGGLFKRRAGERARPRQGRALVVSSFEFKDETCMDLDKVERLKTFLFCQNILLILRVAKSLILFTMAG